MYRDPELEALLRALGEDEEVQAILDSATGPKTMPRVLRMLEALAFERGVDLENLSEFTRPDSELIAGPIPVGVTEHGQPVGITPNHLQHQVIWGQTGKGKSNYILVLLLCIWLKLQASIGAWLFDRKRDFACLVKQVPDLVVIKAGTDLRWNPMKPPPGVPPRKHIHQHVGLLVQAFSLGEAGRSLLIEAHHDLYKRFGCYEGSDHWPTLHELVEWLKAKAQQNPKNHDLQGYVNRILNKLVPMLFVTGEVFACSKDFLHQLVHRKVVFETDMLDGAPLTYLTSGLLQWYMSYRLDNNLRSPLRHLLVFEEAKKHYDAKREANASEVTYLSDVTSQIREFGVGIIVSDQQPSAVARSIKVNASSTLCFALGEGLEIRIVSESMRLSRSQSDQLPGLPIGTAACVLSEGWVEPFILKVPLANVQKDLKSEEIEKLNEPRLKALTYTPANPKPPHNVSTGQGQQDHPTPRKAKKSHSAPVGRTLASLHQEFMHQVHDNPSVPITRHYRALRLYGGQISEVREELFEKRGLLAAIRIGRRKYPYLTEAGYRALGLTPKGKGEALHVHLQRMVLEQLAKKGLEGIRVEGYQNGKAADVVAQSDGKLLAFEIELRNAVQAVENVRKDLEAGFHEVIVLSPFPKVLAGIREACESNLDEQLLSRVRFVEMKRFLGT